MYRLCRVLFGLFFVFLCLSRPSVRDSLPFFRQSTGEWTLSLSLSIHFSISNGLLYLRFTINRSERAKDMGRITSKTNKQKRTQLNKVIKIERRIS